MIGTSFIINGPDDKHKLMLIDLDGTLYLGDTFIDFLRLTRGRCMTYLLILRHCLPLLLSKIGIGSAGDIKERIIAKLYKGETKRKLHEYGRLFASSYFTKNENKRLLNQLSKLNGRKVIVSASIDWWVSEIARHLDMEYICTRTEYEGKASNEIFTGRFSTPNCVNQEKSIRINKEINLSDYQVVFAFGNSEADLSIFQLADYAYWVTKSGQIKEYKLS